MIRLKTPLKEVEKLKVGDEIRINGELFTARDAAHKYLYEIIDKKFQALLKGGVIYHCGPIVKKFEIVSAGPTTSMRMDRYLPEIIKKYRIKAIIGKGGIGNETINAMKKYKCVYLSAIGGASYLLAKHLKILEVFKLKEFGPVEAIWRLQADDFPCIVAIDAKGNSIYERVFRQSEKAYKEMIE